MSKSDTKAPQNRLSGTNSPYLLLHRYNPVNWYPWGEEAIEKARREDRPIFLSVGYATCYWCHVMERESFSDRQIAELLNREFVSIKLDREERPDLDEIYMTATQIFAGQGGWPNSLFLTPDLKPFFAGTYFPPEDRPGHPGFRTVLLSLADAWKTRRGEVEEQAESLAIAVRHHLYDRPEPAEAPAGKPAAERAMDSLRRTFDPQWGGFGGAPKFPTPSNLLFLQEFAGEDPEAERMLSETLDQMARGGIYDQLAGGFHRYATDREWKVPHFEKMLYDNGWLLELYAGAWERQRDPQAARVLRQTADFLRREMTAPDGAFYSALDAETDGHEGAFYVWTRDDLLAILGEEEFGFLRPLLGFAEAPFFEGGAYVLHLPERLKVVASGRHMTAEELLEQIEPLKKLLLRARSARRRPATDDKVLTDWNGAAISGLAEAGRVLGEPAMVDQAAAAAEFVLRELRTGQGRLLHAWRAGSAHIPAFLADYAGLIRGLLALHRASGDERWLQAATELTEQQDKLLGEPDGAFFLAPEDSYLLVRSRDLTDGAVPSANGLAVLNLLELAEATGEGRWRDRAEECLRAVAPVVERFSEPTRTLVVAGERLADRSA